MTQLTKEMVARYAAGQIEVQNASAGYLYRGEIDTITVEGTDEDAVLKVTLRWMVKGEGFPPLPTSWTPVDNHNYDASLQIYTAADIGDGRLSLSSFVVGETTVLFPPGYSTFNPNIPDTTTEPSKLNDDEWETLRKLVDPDGDSIEFDLVDSETVDIAIKQGPHEVCRLGLTNVQLDVLIDRLQRVRLRMKP